MGALKSDILSMVNGLKAPSVWKPALILLSLASAFYLEACRSSKPHANVEMQQATAKYRWEKSDSAVTLWKDTEVVWTLNFNKNQDKPYFHPLRVKNCDLTLERPADHPWHRGLWFSWKLINGINYWEEDPKKGYSEGRSYIKEVNAELHDNYSATIFIKMEYGPDEQNTLLTESRVLDISAPDKQEGYTIDWKLSFLASDSGLVFDRTPPAKLGGPAANWGGYGGLSYRASRKLTRPVFTSSSGWTTKDDLTGEAGNADWIDMTATASGTTGQLAGITIFDHINNLRSPTPWYIWYTEGQNLFFTPALLYNDPLKIKAHEKFELNYRTYIHAGKPAKAYLKKMYEDFISGK